MKKVRKRAARENLLRCASTQQKPFLCNQVTRQVHMQGGTSGCNSSLTVATIPEGTLLWNAKSINASF